MINLMNTAYANPTNATTRAVRDAMAAWCAGPVSPVLELGLKNLKAAYDQKCDLLEVERAERYLAECWAEVSS